MSKAADDTDEGPGVRSEVALARPADGRRFTKTLWAIASLAIALGVTAFGYDRVVASPESLQDASIWGYDAAIYALAAISFGRGKPVEQATALVLALILGFAGFQGGYFIWSELANRTPDIAGDSSASTLIVAGGAILEAALLFRFRSCGDLLMRATWFSARNSALVSAAGAVVIFFYHGPSPAWPQVVTDSLDTLMTFQAAYAVLRETFS